MEIAKSMTTSVDNSSGEFFASMHVADGRINKRHGDQEAKEGEM